MGVQRSCTEPMSPKSWIPHEGSATGPCGAGVVCASSVGTLPTHTPDGPPRASRRGSDPPHCPAVLHVLGPPVLHIVKAGHSGGHTGARGEPATTLLARTGWALRAASPDLPRARLGRGTLCRRLGGQLPSIYDEASLSLKRFLLWMCFLDACCYSQSMNIDLN